MMDAAQKDLGFEIPIDAVPLPSRGLVYESAHPLAGKTEVEYRAMTAREEIADAEYELKRFRKKINYGDGKSVDPFVPGTYEAATSKLGDGPHKKARPRVNWNEKKYQEWIDSVAAEGGADHAYDMAQNAKNEPGRYGCSSSNANG